MMLSKFSLRSGKSYSSIATVALMTVSQWGLLEMVAPTPQAIAQTNLKFEMILEPSDDEPYKVFLARAEAHAEVKVQSFFDRDLLRTEVKVTVLGQRGVAIAPVLTIRVSRNEWTAYPDPEIWSVYYPESRQFLRFSNEPVIVEEATELPVDDSNATFIIPPTDVPLGRNDDGSITNPSNNNRYILSSIGTWDQAQAEAVALGGNLVTINDAAEQQWLYQNFISQDSSGVLAGEPQSSPFAYWIGLTDRETEGQFVWVSGEPVTYSNFASGEPNNTAPDGEDEDYGAMGLTNQFNGQWNDGNQEWGQARGIIEIPGTL